MGTERSYAYQLHFPFEEVDEHGKFVQPAGSQKASPAGDAEVVGEFASFFEVVFLIDIGLQVFGIGMHGTEFKHRDQLAVFADAFEPDKEAVGRLFVVIGCFCFAYGHVEELVDDLFFTDFEAAAVEPS